MRKLLTILFIAIFSVAAFSANKHVKPDATGAGTGTFASPWTLIQAANLTAPGDTVDIWYSADTVWTYPLVPFNNGTEANPIVFRGRNGRSKIVVEAASYAYCMYNAKDYIHYVNLEFLMNGTTTIGPQTARNLVYLAPGGDHIKIDSCWIHTNEDLYALHAAEAYVHGIFQFDAQYVTVTNTLVERTRFHWFTTGNNLPRYTVFSKDTLRYAWMSGIDFQSPTGPIYIAQEILLENSLIDSVLQEDGIQWEHDYTGESAPHTPYWGLFTPQHMGYVIRKNEFKRIGENAFDTKGGYKDIIIEDNIIHNVVGDDNGPFLGGSGGGRILGRNSEDNIIQPAIQYHKVSSTGWHIVRGNVMYDIGMGSHMNNGIQYYNNTHRSNRRRFNGWNVPIDSVTSYMFETQNDWGAETVEYSYQRLSLIVNNLFCDAPKGNIYLTHTNDSLNENGNAFYDTAGAPKNIYRVSPYTWPTFSLGTADTENEWQTELQKSWYSNTVGEDAVIVWDQDPLFVDFPATPWGARYTAEIGTGSPMIGAAVPLAYITTASNNQAVISVSTVYPFSEGYPNISVKGDSIICTDWLHAVEITGISDASKYLFLSEAVTTVIGDSVWWWHNGVKVDDIGAWQFGQGGAGSPPPPPPPPPIEYETLYVDWNYSSVSFYLDLGDVYGEYIHIEFLNKQRRDVQVYISNGEAHKIRWDSEVLWITAAPPVVPPANSWYTFARTSGGTIYGAMVAPTSGELGVVEWSDIGGDITQAGALINQINKKVDTTAVTKMDTTGISLADSVSNPKMLIAHGSKIYLTNGFWEGTDAFTTTSVRDAVYVPGVVATARAQVTIRNEDGTTLPVAGDFMSAYCKTDSLVVLRVAGTTSALEYNYLIRK